MRKYNRITKLILLFCITLILPNIANAQLANEYSNWLLYNNMRLKFDLQKDTVTSHSLKFDFPESFSNISDSNGNLILATTYNSIISFNADTITKIYSSNRRTNNRQESQSSLILKLFGYNSRYITFHINDSLINSPKWDNFDSTNIEYNIIDYNGIDFDFVSPTKRLRSKVRDLITAYFNDTDSSYTFLLMTNLKDSILSYKCDKYGNINFLNSTNIETITGFFRTEGYFASKSALRISPNGKFIASCGKLEPFSCIIPFEPSNGLFGKPLKIVHYFEDSTENVGAGTCEFSPNSNKIYFSYIFKSYSNYFAKYCNTIQQYDLTDFTESKVNNSVADYTNILLENRFFSNILRGIDNKIYIQCWKGIMIYDSNYKYNFIPKIDKPNEILNNKNYNRNLKLKDTLFNSTKQNFIFPNIPANVNYQKFKYARINAKLLDCETGNYQFTFDSDLDSSDLDIEWTGPNGYKSNMKSPIIQINNQLKSGRFYLKASHKISGYYILDSIDLKPAVVPKAEIGLLGSLSLCQGDSVKLYIKDKLPSVNYEWIVNNAIVNADTIVAKVPQKYRLIARNKTLSGCADSTEIEVTDQAKEKLVINGIKSFCEGDSTKLEISKPYPGVQFEWNTGERTNSIIVNKAGTYWCKAINNNCLTADTIKVSINPNPVISILGDTTLCKNATGVLTLNGSYTSCTWSSGENTPSITITKAGIYSAQAENQFGCKSTAQIEVKEISNNIDLSKFQDIDFGKTKINETITKELDLTGINPSNIKLLNNTEFTFISSGNKLEITYKAAKKGSAEDSLFIEIDKPCQETIALKLKAEGEGEQIITLKVADIEVLAGDTDVPLQITYKLNEGVSLPQTITWTAKLNYKTAIYYPDITGDVKSANRNIDILLSGTKTLTKKEDTLTIIKGKTYIADTIYTKVNLIDFTVNPNFTIIKEDGSIKITGLCVPNLRGIEFFTPTTMTIKPNPSNGEVDIEFTNEENGETKLKLFNSAGAEVLTESKIKKDKSITFHFDKLDLPNGVYQAQIEQSGKILQSASLMIEK